MESLDIIFNKYGSDKSSYFHNYSRQYEQLFKPYRNKDITYLEIGVFMGESLLTMREVFKNAKYIVGIDINPECKKYEDVNNNIFIEIGDATDINFIEYIINKYGGFDIILDDGSHVNKDMIKSFELLFPCINNNGLYIVEDLVTYKMPGYFDRNYQNHLEYFYQYIPFLNQTRYNSTEGIIDHCADPFKIQKKSNNIFEIMIDRIEFGCGYIGIHKKTRYHWIP